MRRTEIVLASIVLLIPTQSLATSFPLRAAQESAPQILAHAIELHRAGDFEKAVREYQAFLAVYPDAADVRSNLGAAYVQLGLFERAIQEYRLALQLPNATDPASIRFNLALGYYKTAQFDEAVGQLTQVIAAQPNNLKAISILADCHLQSGRNRAVVELLLPHEQDAKDDPFFTYLLGTALLRDGQLGEGERRIEKLFRKGDSAEAHLMLGTAYLMVRDVPGALKEFERAMGLNPALPSLNAYHGKALRDMGRLIEADAAFLKELQVNPNDFNSNLHHGVYLYKNEQRYDEALVYLEHALKVRPGDPAVRFQIGLVYMLMERIDEALAWIEQVVNDAPDFLEAHITLTRLYYRLKRKEDAERHRAIVDKLRTQQDAQRQEATQQPSRQQQDRVPGGERPL